MVTMICELFETLYNDRFVNYGIIQFNIVEVYKFIYPTLSIYYIKKNSLRLGNAIVED